MENFVVRLPSRMLPLSLTGFAFVLSLLFSPGVHAESMFSIAGVSNTVWVEAEFDFAGSLSAARLIDSTEYESPTEHLLAWETSDGMKLVQLPFAGDRVYTFWYEHEVGEGWSDASLAGIPIYFAPDTQQYLLACAFFPGGLEPDLLCDTAGYAFQVQGTLSQLCGLPADHPDCDPYMGLLMQGADSTFTVEWDDRGPSIASLKDQVADWRTLRHAVAYNPLPQVIEAIQVYEGSASTSFGDRQEQLVHWAAYYNRLDVMEHLLLLGHDVNSPARYGVTPLMHAARNGSLEVMRQMVDSGADLAELSDANESALHYAVARGNLSVVQYLLDHGADADTKSAAGVTPLMLAVTEEIAESLISAGAALNARNTNGWTALHFAAYRNPGLVQVLLQHGADVHARTTDGMTPLMMAANHGDLETIDAIINAGARINDATTDALSTPLSLAVSHGHLEVVRRFLELGAPVQQRSNLGTLLHRAVHLKRDSDPQLLQLLLDSGVPLEATDLLGNTALHEAASSGNLTAIVFLLDAGANGQAQNLLGQTPYAAAEMMLNFHTHMRDSEALWRLHDATFQ